MIALVIVVAELWCGRIKIRWLKRLVKFRRWWERGIRLLRHKLRVIEILLVVLWRRHVVVLRWHGVKRLGL